MHIVSNVCRLLYTCKNIFTYMANYGDLRANCDTMYLAIYTIPFTCSHENLQTCLYVFLMCFTPTDDSHCHSAISESSSTLTNEESPFDEMSPKHNAHPNRLKEGAASGSAPSRRALALQEHSASSLSPETDDSQKSSTQGMCYRVERLPKVASYHY